MRLNIIRYRLQSFYKWSASFTKSYAKKRLFPPKFSDDNGDGDYADDSIIVLSATIKNEINKAGTLEMDILTVDEDLLKPYWDFICVFDRYDSQTKDVLFFGRVITVECQPDGTSHVICEGHLACLTDAPMMSMSKVSPFKFSENKSGKSVSWTLGRAFSTAMHWYREILKRDDLACLTNLSYSRINYAPEGELSISAGTSCGSFIMDELIGNYGGIVTITYDNYTIPFGNNPARINWIDDPTSISTWSIVSDSDIHYKVNLLDVSYENANSEIFTAVMPWFDQDPEDDYSWRCFSIGNGFETPAWYEKQEMVNKYGLILISRSFSGCKTGDDLKRKATEWLKINCRDYAATYTFKAVDLHYIDPYDSDVSSSNASPSNINRHWDGRQYTKRIHILDKVEVTYPQYIKHLDTTAQRSKMICLSVTYDLFHPENDEFVIGPVIPPDLSEMKFISKNKK